MNQGLANVIESDERFMHCVTEKFISYARGALSGARDNCRVEDISERAASSEFSVRELVKEIVLDTSFLNRRTADED